MKLPLVWIKEPRLLFRYDQRLEDPRDGLTLFGPLEQPRIYGVRAGVVGTQEGIRRYKQWIRRIQQAIISNDEEKDAASYIYPGFKAVFGIDWHPDPVIEIPIPDDAFETLHITDKHHRVYETVNLYEERIRKAINEEDPRVDVWFVVIPNEVYRDCRPRSEVKSRRASAKKISISPKRARRLQTEPSLFTHENEAAKPYRFKNDFHNQLKARLLDTRAIVQVVREITLAPEEFPQNEWLSEEKLIRLQAEIAWALSIATYYKAGGRPWKTADVREGVCYLGLVFKQDSRNTDPRSACCAAQMFLDTGDGMIFKGRIGPWYNPKKSHFHLSRDAARDLVEKAVEDYKQKHPQQKPPKELFIHGRVGFNDEEWSGFREGAGKTTHVIGVYIQDARFLRLYRPANYSAMRGLAYVESPERAYLWTKGYTPRIQSYPGREVPVPLYVRVCRGEADIEVVLDDLMALTKLNYNSATFADGLPVTLRFADVIGEILTAGPIDTPPLPFRHYI